MATRSASDGRFLTNREVRLNKGAPDAPTVDEACRGSGQHCNHTPSRTARSTRSAGIVRLRSSGARNMTS